MSTAQVPPQNLDAEEHVLGAILLSPSVIFQVSDKIGPGDFYSHKNGSLFRAFLEMDAAGVPIDHISACDWLDQQGRLEECGGSSRLRELTILVPAAANAAHYASIVREMAGLRGLIRAGQEISRLGWERPGELENLNDRAEQAIFSATQEHYRGDLELIGRAIEESYLRIEHIADGSHGVVGLSTGFSAVDEILGGIEAGNLVVVAARPSMGKSAFALSLVAKVGIREQKPVALHSLEMSKPELAQRLQSSGSLVPLQKLRRGQLSAEEWSRLQEASAKIAAAPIFVDDTSDVSLSEMRSKVRRLKLQQPELALVIVDYLQLMDGPQGQNRNQQISELTRGLKILARQVEVPIVLLSQLSRAVEQKERKDKRPVLSDLRDSGSIEQDADIVIFLYRDEYYNRKTKKPGTAEIIVAKNRMGPTDTAELAFHKSQAKFQEHAQGRIE